MPSSRWAKWAKADNGPVKPSIELVHGVRDGFAALPLRVIIEKQVQLPLVIGRQIVKRDARAEDGQALGVFPPGVLLNGFQSL